MADVSVRASTAASGTTTTASAPLSVQVGNLLICYIAALGTGVVIADPTSSGDTWQKVDNQVSADGTFSYAMYFLPNLTAATHTPSSDLSGSTTITGWDMVLMEMTPFPPDAAPQGFTTQLSTVAQLTNIFSTTANTLPRECFFYAVGRPTATITRNNTTNSPLVVWSASVRTQIGQQGISQDQYFVSMLGQGIGPYPKASGLLSSAVNSIAIGARFISSATQPLDTQISGKGGFHVGQYRGMIGG
jgi:hypothetical protein